MIVFLFNIPNTHTHDCIFIQYTQAHDRLFSWLGTDTSINIDLLQLVL
jgi:hypothetical protein